MYESITCMLARSLMWVTINDHIDFDYFFPLDCVQIAVLSNRWSILNIDYALRTKSTSHHSTTLGHNEFLCIKLAGTWCIKPVNLQIACQMNCFTNLWIVISFFSLVSMSSSMQIGHVINLRRININTQPLYHTRSLLRATGLHIVSRYLTKVSDEPTGYRLIALLA